MSVATEETIRSVVQEVLSQLGHGTSGTGNGASCSGDWGVCRTVDDAVSAATEGFRKLTAATLDDRRRVVDCVKKVCEQQAEELGRAELEETRIGRLDHKIEKLQIVKPVPGVEFLRSDARSGDHGVTVTEYAPFGVIGAFIRVTHALPTTAGTE